MNQPEVIDTTEYWNLELYRLELDPNVDAFKRFRWLMGSLIRRLNEANNSRMFRKQL